MKTHTRTLLSSALAVFLPLTLPAVTNTWIGPSGDWDSATNWSTGATPGPGDVAVIPAGPAITVTHSLNQQDTVSIVQCAQAFILSAGSLTVTNGNSQFTGSFSITSGALLGASGPATTVLCSGPTTADDANFTVTGGATVTLPNLQNFTKECNGANWIVSGAGSLLSVPALTNITGQSCFFPNIEAENGGQMLAPNLVSIEAGPLNFQADGTNSVVDLSALSVCNGQNGYLVTFEASAGGTLKIPNVKGGSLVGVTINPGATIDTPQLCQLYSLSVYGVTDTFGALSNLSELTVSNIIMNFPVLINMDDGNINLSAGATVTLPVLSNFNKYCNGANWTVNGVGTALILPALTNITGQACNYPTIEVENGAQLLATNLATIHAGPLAFAADGTNSLINLNSLSVCAGQSGYLVTFEASAGGTIVMPNMVGGPLTGVTISPGGTMPTAQIRQLFAINVYGVTNTFDSLTNLTSLTVSGLTLNFPALINMDDSILNLSTGAVVTMPVLGNFIKYCNGANWTINGVGTLLSLPALTNITGQACNFPTIEVENGGQLLATNLATIQAGPLAFNADGAGSLINLISLTSCTGQNPYQVTFEASAGGTIIMPNMTGGPFVSVTVNPGGTLPTSQIQMLYSLNLPGVTNNYNALTNLTVLTASGVTMTFPSLVNFNDGNVSLSGGAVITMPALQSYTKLTCGGANWTVTGPGTILDLPALTNINGQVCNFPVMQAENGGEILATNLAGVQLGPLAFQADGSNSLVDLSGLLNGTGEQGYYLTFEASAGGTMRIQKLTNAQLTGLIFNSGGSLTPTSLVVLNNGYLEVPSGSLNLPALANIDGSILIVTNGSSLSLPGVGNYNAGTQRDAYWTVGGLGSQLSLSGLTNLTGDLQPGYNLLLDAEAGGDLVLNNIQSIYNGNVAILSDGTGSVIDLSGLSGFVLQSGVGSLSATNGGNILLNTQAFLLANVAVNISAGNPVLPPTLIASSALTLYGQAWHSYLVQERNTLIPNSPYTFLARVPLTNAFQAIAPVPPPNTAFKVTEFVANPPLLDLSLAGADSDQMILYAAPGKTNQIQVSTNLLRNSWTNYGGLVAMTNSFYFLPQVTPSQPYLFYRSLQY